MRMNIFTAERSLYRATGYYAGMAGSYAWGTGHVTASQTLPTCGSGNYTNCAPGTLQGCATNCIQKCVDVTGTVPITRLECCPPGKCGGSGDCCKTVCCTPNVS
jgi:hypothetical protein